MKATSNGMFQGESPFDFAVPLAIFQICLVIAFTRSLAFILKPMRQPRVIAEIIGGILLGPSAFGRNHKFLDKVFPKKSLTVLDTLANIGLIFFMFLVGLELDMRAIRRVGKKALAISIAGITLPFVIGIATSFVLSSTISKGVDHLTFLVFIGVSLSITAFPVLGRILTELKLLTTDVGRMAMSAAAVDDVTAWILLALAIALSGKTSSPLISVWILLCGIAFVVGAFLLIKPALALMARRSAENNDEPVKELYICITLALVLAAGFITDLIGIHAIFGAFVIGILVPKDGPFAGVLIEKIEDLVSSLFLPLYFVSSGLKLNIGTINGARSWGLVALVIFNACFGKIVGVVGVSLLFKTPFRESLTLGFLMNTKGLVELIVLNIGKDRKVLNDEAFAILVLMALFTTFITTPIVMAIYKPARKAAPYKHRTVERKDIDTELRILTCFYGTENIPAIVNLIESSRGTRRQGCLSVYAMHLKELSERYCSAISMVHKPPKNTIPFLNKKCDNKEHMVITFEEYQQLSRVTLRPMTAISALDDIHENICTSAKEKRAAMIILPFHKHQRLDGVMESLGHSIHVVNQQVLCHSPCSVGILVNRGLGGTTQVSAKDVSYTIAVPFFGGRDDREALAYGFRMAEHPGIKLTVLKLVSTQGKEKDGDNDNDSDEAFISECTARNKNESTSIEEKQVGSNADIIDALTSINKCNLILVGRVPRNVPELGETSSDCPELGPVGSFLASSEYSNTASVLVVQQYHPNSNRQCLVEEA
ncbi:cation/H(+) antiporter 19 [Cornus florida]|uniref:cation/H(+) antiporter 19 n=1 Tax=Cornus florida TaxID=4283 RepID=UPI00289D2A39|nr:cation/H(+) antiporter 19 [Cornus florida]